MVMLTISVEAMIILALLTALIIGQPRAWDADRATIKAQSTTISQYQSGEAARTMPTLRSTYACPQYPYC